MVIIVLAMGTSHYLHPKDNSAPETGEEPADTLPSLDAVDQLRYIRETMQRAGSFTAVPGWGGVIMGATALAAAFLAAQQPTFDRWLKVWLGEAVLAVLIGCWAMDRKAIKAGQTLFNGPGRKFTLSFAPPVFVGALLTLTLYRGGLRQQIPGMLLLLYGTGVVTGGAFSVPVIPVLGTLFMALGTAALFSPAWMGNWYMAAGFGLLHIIFGIIIVRRYGG
jgi:hypothetical protein